MIHSNFQKTVIKVLLLTVVMGFVFGSIFEAQEVKAIANWVVPSGTMATLATSVPEFSWVQYLKDVLAGIGYALAHKISTKFLDKFVHKLTSKYKIRNYLYYDQVLSNYYLVNFIRDKITDPDLRQIYVLMEAAYISGQPTGLANAPNPNKALIPRIKTAVANLYTNETGVDPNNIANPPANISNRDYLRQAQFFYLNSPGYTEANLRSRFGAFQANATTAAQLEVLVGNSLKAGRFIGGTCSVTTPVSESGATIDPKTSPEACAQAGGTWDKSALDEARSFIDNPTAYVSSHLVSSIGEKINANYNPNNFWFVIGQLLGNAIWNNLLLDKPNGVLNEDPRGYTPEAYSSSNSNLNQIDLDGDGQPDGYDIDNDGIIDNCIFGGTAPNCTTSSSLNTGPPGGGAVWVDCGVPPASIIPDPMPTMQQVMTDFPGLVLDENITPNDRETFTAIVAWRLHQIDSNWGRKDAGNGRPISQDTLGYLRPDVGPGRFEAVDIISSSGILQTGCYGVVPAVQNWIQPVQAP